MEEWRPVRDFSGVYEVSNRGRVRRVVGGKATKPGRLLKVNIRKQDRRGTVSMCYQGREATRSIHSVVAESFLGPCPEGLEINHIDGDPTNNELSNLEYCSHLDNMRHAYRLGLVKLGIGEDQHLAKLTTEQIVVIRNCKAPARLLARVFGVSRTTIKQVQRGTTWKHV